jgi:predicted N-acetyltransferase YhbS
VQISLDGGSFMSITLRQYNPADFKSVSDFLIANYQPGMRDGNWLQPAWEYMHSHPNLDESTIVKIGVWEDAGDIVGVAHHEFEFGEAFFQIHPDYPHLRPIMLEYAEAHLYGETESGERYLQIDVKDFELEFEVLLESRNYELSERYSGPMTAMAIPEQFPEIVLPEGFRIKSLADENNLNKIHRVLWRGFDHEGEPPEEGIEWRRKMQSGPNFRKDLTIVVEAPSGDFVSFCGLWYVPENRYAYVEPMATDPDYRRMGLGRAALLEGLRRCAVLGATVAYVGSGQEFYRSMGFKTVYDCRLWIRRF